MSYPYHVPEGYAEEEITAVIAESIAFHLEYAQRRLSAYQLHCTDFEQRHGMNTVLLRLDFINQAAAVKVDADMLDLI